MKKLFGYDFPEVVKPAGVEDEQEDEDEEEV